MLIGLRRAGYGVLLFVALLTCGCSNNALSRSWQRRCDNQRRTFGAWEKMEQRRPDQFRETFEKAGPCLAGDWRGMVYDLGWLLDLNGVEESLVKSEEGQP